VYITQCIASESEEALGCGNERIADTDVSRLQQIYVGHIFFVVGGDGAISYIGKSIVIVIVTAFAFV